MALSGDAKDSASCLSLLVSGLGHNRNCVSEITECQSKGPRFEPTYCSFETWTVSLNPVCLCLLDETLKTDDSFYLVSMPGEVKYPTLGVNVDSLALI